MKKPISLNKTIFTVKISLLATLHLVNKLSKLRAVTAVNVLHILKLKPTFLSFHQRQQYIKHCSSDQIAMVPRTERNGTLTHRPKSFRCACAGNYRRTH